MAKVRLFAAAREAAGTGTAEFEGVTVGDVVAAATAAFGPRFGEVVETCRIWRNGEPAAPGDLAGPGDEVAILPPVSGG